MEEEPVIIVEYDVIAYDESGYGDNCSRTFTNGNLAVAYAKSLDKCFGATVWKKISMQTIRRKIYSYTE